MLKKRARKEKIEMLRWMIGIKRIVKIRNEEIIAMAGLANIGDNIREATLGWLGHVVRKRLNKIQCLHVK